MKIISRTKFFQRVKLHFFTTQFIADNINIASREMPHDQGFLLHQNGNLSDQCIIESPSLVKRSTLRFRRWGTKR